MMREVLGVSEYLVELFGTFQNLTRQKQELNIPEKYEGMFITFN